jgi:hypothetical protein
MGQGDANGWVSPLEVSRLPSGFLVNMLTASVQGLELDVERRGRDRKGNGCQ